ncbi:MULTISPECIES: ABC transporter ATP-binding protein [Halomonadaceae]|uniref:ABC transporter ATP-binding protein n=1 Tax=Halomonadaceae TaxID=28256 RepID=UPI001583723F|nr:MULTISPECIES: ABC transporter ATP-binding protein [Halomonas]MDI4637441.1 ABC transporter ATP-binding protein [Halomonas sp. BMC7]NUJ61275.1 ABC transporter ATP-binding protein [Halomonas taeanensis]
MIEIRNLYKRYHNHHGSDWVLKDINLSIPRGVSVGLIGANGAGKSTLLRLIAGMDVPERGEVIKNCRMSWPIGLASGMQGNMTGRQNVKFVARVHGGGVDVQRVIDFVEDFAEIGDAFDEPVRTYSSGMKSRISFGLSLAFDFEVYISDEATAVGDKSFKEKASQAFKDRIGRSSLIMVSHSEGILKDLCQAGVYLKDGSATWYDNVNDAIANYHRDVEAKKAAREQAKGQSVPHADSASAENAQALKKAKAAMNNAKADINALSRSLKRAEKRGWESDELAALQKAHKLARSHLKRVKKRFDEMSQQEDD